MINNLSILATLVLIALVIVRAIALDKTRPWFGPDGSKPEKRNR